MPEVEGYPPAQPYSAVQQLMQDEMQDAVKASAGERAYRMGIHGHSLRCHAMQIRCSYPESAVREWLTAVAWEGGNKNLCLAELKQEEREGAGAPLALPAPPNTMLTGDTEEER